MFYNKKGDMQKGDVEKQIRKREVEKKRKRNTEMEK